MNAIQAALLMAQLLEIEDITQKALTPEGRWDLWQAWLLENPDWRIQVEAWVVLPPVEALSLFRAWLSKKAEMPVSLLKKIITPVLEQRALAVITTIQELYKARVNADNQNQLTEGT